MKLQIHERYILYMKIIFIVPETSSFNDQTFARERVLTFVEGNRLHYWRRHLQNCLLSWLVLFVKVAVSRDALNAFPRTPLAMYANPANFRSLTRSQMFVFQGNSVKKNALTSLDLSTCHVSQCKRKKKKNRKKSTCTVTRKYVDTFILVSI